MAKTTARTFNVFARVEPEIKVQAELENGDMFSADAVKRMRK